MILSISSGSLGLSKESWTLSKDGKNRLEKSSDDNSKSPSRSEKAINEGQVI